MDTDNEGRSKSPNREFKLIEGGDAAINPEIKNSYNENNDSLMNGLIMPETFLLENSNDEWDEEWIETDRTELNFELVEMYKPTTNTFKILNKSNLKFKTTLKALHEEWLDDYDKSILLIEPASFILDPEMIREISVTVRPDRVNIEKFFIEASLKFLEKVPTHQCKLVNVCYLGEHPHFQVTEIMTSGRHPAWNVQQCWSMFELDRLNECLTPFNKTSFEHTVPIVETVSIRFPPAPINCEPATFSFLLKNTSDIEGTFNIHQVPPKDWLPILSTCEREKRIPTFHGSHPDDPKALSVLWFLKFTNKKIEQDFNGLYYGRKPNMKKSLVKSTKTALPGSTASYNSYKDLKWFKFSPLKGSIPPGKSKQITIQYSYEKEGAYKISVLVRINPAIFIWFDLYGTTLAYQQPSLELLHCTEMLLHPIGLADLDPPLQSFWMYNGGYVDCPYEIDMTPFEDLKDNNHGHSVFSCLNPKGVVGSKSWSALKIRFSPLEVMDYELPIRIFANQEVREVKIKGSVALSPQISLRSKTEEMMARKSHLIDPIVFVTISPNRLVFPNLIPTGDSATNIIFITNMSSNQVISFKWNKESFEGDGFIKFHPESGTINPLQETSVMVVVKAGCVSTTFSTLIRCMMSNVTATEKYFHNLTLWENQEAKKKADQERFEAEIKKQRASFKAINVQPIKKLKNEVVKPHEPLTFSRVISVSVYIGSVFGLLDSILINDKVHPPFMDQLKPKTRTLFLGPNFPLGKNIAEDMINQMIWDITRSTSIGPFIRRVTKREAPYYDEYKRAEETNNCLDEDDFVRLNLKTKEQLIEFAVINLMQELAKDYNEGSPIKVIDPIELKSLLGPRELLQEYLDNKQERPKARRLTSLEKFERMAEHVLKRENFSRGTEWTNSFDGDETACRTEKDLYYDASVECSMPKRCDKKSSM